MRIAIAALALVACAPAVQRQSPEDARAAEIKAAYDRAVVARAERRAERERQAVSQWQEREAAEARAQQEREAALMARVAAENRASDDLEASCSEDREARRGRHQQVVAYVEYRNELDQWEAEHCIRVDHGKSQLQTRTTHDGIVYQQWATVGKIETRCDGAKRPPERPHPGDEEFNRDQVRNAHCERADASHGGALTQFPKRHRARGGASRTYLADPDE